MDPSFHSSRAPYEPTLAELVDNIRRNLEAAARGSNFQPVNQRGSSSSGSLPQNFRCVSPGPSSFSACGILTPRNRSRTSSSSSIASSSSERRCQSSHFPGSQESLLQAAAARLRRGNGGLNDFAGQNSAVCTSPGRPLFNHAVMHMTLTAPTLASIGENLLTSELDAACWCADYPTSCTPSEVAGEDTYEFVERLTEVDYDSDAWTFENT